MIKNKFLYFVLGAGTLLLAGTACKKQLNIGNPNAATLDANVSSETGLYSFTQGATYIDGFVNGDGWLGDSYFSLPYGYSELLGDVVGADAANQEISVVSVPDKVTTEDGTTVINTSPQIPFLRSYNTRGNTGAGNNVYYYQWLNMYALNNACNTILDRAASIKFSGDAATRLNTIKAWCYWWKGYAYASVGTQYYSGLVIDAYGGVSNHYLVHDSIIARSNYYFNLASGILSGITNTSDYSTALAAMIPTAFQTASGGVPTPAQWIRNINTMLARNLLLNKLNPFVNGVVNSTIQKSATTAMTAADWTSVLNYATNGIQQGDVVFAGAASSTNAVFTPSGGTASANTLGNNIGSLFKITERFIQNFNIGDARLSNNFTTANTYNNPNFTTRYSMVDGGNGASGVYVYGTKTPLAYILYMAGSYEENALMLAEANIMLGSTDKGLGYVDAVRKFQGAGVAAVAATGLTQAQALTQLTRERRVSLVFRGLSWYDSRRWGWSYDVSNGGGSYGNTFVTVSGKIYTNTTINYNFLDYWDVPADESVLNPAGSASAATVNPNF
ncbi:MAG TPA: RagB/SusD family nutrient uptake outer membrane protein [Puia sp.]